jgi:CO/xanthine dehydrogenase FAD-binding subunit
VSGAFAFPRRCLEAENVLNDGALPFSRRAAAVATAPPHPILEDMRASAAYRRMLFEKCIGEALAALAGIK